MAKKSISFCKGKGSIAHNNRDFIALNVDKSRTENNITYKCEPLEDAYAHCFGQAIEDYNAKQRRADRRINGIKGYMEQIRTSGNGEKLYYENLVQVGNMNDSRVGTRAGEVATEILDKYMKDFERNNPNLYVFNAVMHLDEATPHLHINYIPVAHGYKNGLQARNSLDRAFKEQGIEGKSSKYENRTIAWQNREKDHIAEIMGHYDIERAPDRGLHREKMTVEQYKAVVEKIHNEVKQMPKQIEEKPVMFNSKYVQVDKKHLHKLEQRAKLSKTHEMASAQILSEVEKSKNEHYTHMRKARYDIERKQDYARAEVNKAAALKEQYDKLHRQQSDLNENYKILSNSFERQKRQLAALQKETEQLRKERNALARSVDKLCEHIKSMTKAYNMFKYDQNDKWRVKLTGEQSMLFDAIETVSKKLLREEKRNDLATDVDEHISISDSISKEYNNIVEQHNEFSRNEHDIEEER